jgi:hypothetical protein
MLKNKPFTKKLLKNGLIISTIVLVGILLFGPCELGWKHFYEEFNDDFWNAFGELVFVLINFVYIPLNVFLLFIGIAVDKKMSGIKSILFVTSGLIAAVLAAIIFFVIGAIIYLYFDPPDHGFI